LIVSGNVFHLHVYTVNNGGGLSAAPFTAAIPIRVGDCVEQTPRTPRGFCFFSFFFFLPEEAGESVVRCFPAEGNKDYFV